MRYIFRGWFANPARTRAKPLPAGLRIYAIGDIHGRSDLLDELLAGIGDDLKRSTVERWALIFLGDYIDRGPDSAGVLDRLCTLNASGNEAYFVLGNHEESLLRVLNGEGRVLGDWLRFGGTECLASYGIEASRLAGLTSASAARAIAKMIPAHHRDFLLACDDSIRFGDYVFVHAGVRPGIPLSQQVQRDLRWIREPFLSSPSKGEFTVVHGHTVSEQVEVHEHRIGIDTGAYRTGVLTALVLEGESRRLLQTQSGPGGVSGKAMVVDAAGC